MRTLILLSIFIGLPLLAEFIASVISMDLIMNVAYIALGAIIIYFINDTKKELVSDWQSKN